VAKSVEVIIEYSPGVNHHNKGRRVLGGAIEGQSNACHPRSNGMRSRTRGAIRGKRRIAKKLA